MTEYTKQRYTKVMQDYISKKGLVSLTKLCKQHDCDRGEVSLFIRSKGIEIINYQNRLKFDNTVFDVIDTEEKAYWLGFIFADGYVSDRNDFELSLKLSDKLHLEKFKKFLKWENNVKLDSYRARVILKDKHFVSTLKFYGCVPRKSLILTFPTNIPHRFIKDFIRGYFDGDGSLYESYAWDKKKTCKSYYLAFNLLGTKEFLTKVKTYLNIDSKLYLNNKSNKNTWFLLTLRSNAFHAANYLYENSTIYLERKHNIYLKWKEKYGSKG